MTHVKVMGQLVSTFSPLSPCHPLLDHDSLSPLASIPFSSNWKNGFHTGAKILNLSKNSLFENLTFHKIHILKILLFTKFTISKSHFSQNSQFQNVFFSPKSHFQSLFLFLQNSHFSNIKFLIIYG